MILLALLSLPNHACSADDALHIIPIPILGVGGCSLVLLEHSCQAPTMTASCMPPGAEDRLRSGNAFWTIPRCFSKRRGRRRPRPGPSPAEDQPVAPVKVQQLLTGLGVRHGPVSLVNSSGIAGGAGELKKSHPPGAQPGRLPTSARAVGHGTGLLTILPSVSSRGRIGHLMK
jgi:hypothetical protein